MKRISALSALVAAMMAVGSTALAGEGLSSTYNVTVAVGRTKAINYKYLGGSASIGFKGTVLLPQAEGKAKVKSHEGGATVHAVFEHLQPAARFGPEYMTYVLWAISPVGRATNLGEVLVKPSGRGRIDATTNLQAFGLIVTAEPHFAVTSVSDLVVLENVLTEASRGKVEEVEASYPLLPRGAYVLSTNPAQLTAPRLDRRVSPYVYQARNAMRIAQAAEADRWAPEEYGRAEASLRDLDAQRKLWKKPAVALARQVVQRAEDARLIATTRSEEARLAEVRQAAADARLAAETAQADAEAAQARAAQEALQAKHQASEMAAKEAAAAAKQASVATKRQIRQQLSAQLGRLLHTQDTERGLLVRMSDLLFPVGKAELLPPAREKLAKAAGILLAYPGLKIKVEGHADSTGNPAFNDKLSERRASMIRNYLIRQGLPAQAIVAEGLGASQPLAPNDSPSGRQQNRRVELIVAGEPIGL